MIDTSFQADSIERGDRLVQEAHFREAAECYAAVAHRVEVPPPALCVKLARCHRKMDDAAGALRWALAAAESDDYACWHAAAQIARAAAAASPQPYVRAVRRAALLGSYTTISWAPLLELAALRLGVRLDLVYQSPYGQYRQEILHDRSGLFASRPDLVILAFHDRELELPELSFHAEEDIRRELGRWTCLWDHIEQRTNALIIQHNFATPAESALEHAAGHIPASRIETIQEVNRRLAQLATNRVAMVDCDRLSSIAGKRRWFEPRYWHLSKQAVSPECQPMLARHTAAVIAAMAGAGRKCVVVDLDNVLWGGVIGEDGWAGIRLGHGADGEAFAEFQQYLLALKQRGICLASCSRNNEADAREPFLRHPFMRLRLQDFAVFLANWRPKEENLIEIARTLGMGLRDLVFLDANPGEREAIRQALPEVEVPVLPSDAAEYIRRLADSLALEAVSIAATDTCAPDTRQATAAIPRSEASRLDDHYRSLKMRASIGPFDADGLPRIAQLLGNTDAFNLTGRRHSTEHLAECMEEPRCVHLAMRLWDCDRNYGLAGVCIAFQAGGALEVDTFVVNCEVLDGAAECALLAALCAAAEQRRCSEIYGICAPGANNGAVKDFYQRHGFEPLAADGTRWRYDIGLRGPIHNDFIELSEQEHL